MDSQMQQMQSDHDLLVSLNTKVDAFIVTNTDHEARIRVLEKSQSTDEGASGASKGFVTILISVVAVVEPIVFWLISRSV